MSRTLLIDGDIYLYQACAANERVVQWSTWMWTRWADFEQARAQFDDTIDSLIDELGADRTIIALTDGSNWRKSVMPEYKMNRVKTEKPVVYEPMREYCLETRETFLRESLEGDDILGILCTHPHLIKGEKIVVSIDKDMQTIPGQHLNTRKAREEGGDVADHIYTVTAADADRYHLFQTLTGDTTDGYKGCPGVGPVKANKLLDEEGATWETVLGAYKKAKLGEELALQNARVARILRAVDYDFGKKEVKLWTP